MNCNNITDFSYLCNLENLICLNLYKTSVDGLYFIKFLNKLELLYLPQQLTDYSDLINIKNRLNIYSIYNICNMSSIDDFDLIIQKHNLQNIIELKFRSSLLNSL